MTAKKARRKIELEVEVNAPVDAVWKALSEGEELARWFPLEARVKPGVGGSIWMSWGEPWVGEARIEVWEPGRRLRTTEPPPSGTQPIAIDYILESRGNKTRLRVVQSGFTGADWEDEYIESTEQGWAYMLANLRLYLERHAGTPRRVAWARADTSLPLEETWQRLMGPQGFLRRGRLDGLRPGDRYEVEAATGETFRGVFHYHIPPQRFCGTVENLNDALLALGIEKTIKPPQVWVWLSTYGLPADEVSSFEGRWNELLTKILTAKSQPQSKGEKQ